VAARRAVANRALLFASLISLGLGMGGAIVAYEIIDGIMLHPFPSVSDPERVVRLSVRQSMPGESPISISQVSYPMLVDLRRGVQGLENVAGVFEGDFDDPRGLGRSMRVAIVTSEYFMVFRSAVRTGRVFSTEAEPSSAAPVAVLSDEYERRAFGGQGAALGSQLRLGARTFTVVGVMPSTFRGDALAPIDVWLPLGSVPERLPPGWLSENTGYWLRLVGRLRPGVTLQRAQEEAVRAIRRTDSGPSPGVATEIHLSSLSLARSPDGQPLPEAHLSVWFGVLAGLVLLMATFNVTTLLLASAIERRNEAAIRTALGASRWQLARPLALQSVVLTVWGGAGAVLVAMVLIRWVYFSIPWMAQFRSWSATVRTLGFAVLLSGLTTVIVAAAPVLAVWKQDIGGLLRVQGKTRGVGSAQLRLIMLAGQVGIAVLLLGVSEALVRSFAGIRSLSLGIDARHVVAVQLDVGAQRLRPEAANRLFEDLAAQARTLPGVAAVSVSTTVPFLSAEGLAVFAEADPYPLDASGLQTYFNAVTPGFIAALGTSVFRGRGFTEQDRYGSERVAVVSRNLTDRAWPGLDPLGRCLHLGIDTAPCTRIVGVLREGRLMRLREDPRALVYLPIAQNTFYAPRRALIVRASGDPEAVAVALRRLLAARSDAVADAQVVALQDVVEPQWRQWSVGATACSFLALLGIGLAAFGMYATVSEQTSSRVLELAIRAALGAAPARLLILCAQSVLTTVALGVTLGLCCLVVLSRPLAPLMFQTTTRDLLAVAAPCIVLIGVTAVAVGVPAARAARSDLFANLRAG
jgi:putative ABC transport system permease protein